MIGERGGKEVDGEGVGEGEGEGGKEPGWPSGETESQGKSDVGIRLDQVYLGTRCPCNVTILRAVRPGFRK